MANITPSKYNAIAHEPEAIKVTSDWLKRESPIVYLYGKSGTGKTTILGSLFRHPLYQRVLLIDIDQGSTTISEYTRNVKLCDLRGFEGLPEQRLSWFKQQLKYARTAKCGSIVVEGLLSIQQGIVSDGLEDIDGCGKMEIAQANIYASQVTTVLIEAVRHVKMHRRHAKIGAPIIVTLNTRDVPIDKKKLDSDKKTTPDMSENLQDKAMRSSDAMIELRRGAAGMQMFVQSDDDHPTRKLRSCVPFDGGRTGNAAEVVQRQVNLDLPGMFAAWSKCDKDMQDQIRNFTDPNTQPQAQETP